MADTYAGVASPDEINRALVRAAGGGRPEFTVVPGEQGNPVIAPADPAAPAFNVPEDVRNRALEKALAPPPDRSWMYDPGALEMKIRQDMQRAKSSAAAALGLGASEPDKLPDPYPNQQPGKPFVDYNPMYRGPIEDPGQTRFSVEGVDNTPATLPPPPRPEEHTFSAGQSAGPITAPVQPTSTAMRPAPEPAPGPVEGLGGAPFPEQQQPDAGAGAGGSATAPVTPRGPSGRELYLNRLRESGLSDEEIKQGDALGMWGPTGSMTKAIEDEAAAYRRKAEATSQAADARAWDAKVQQEAENILQADQARERQEIQDSIDARQAKIEDLSKQYGDMEITDPWADKSTGDKVLAGIALALSGVGSGLTGQPNMALQVINDAINRDLEIQSANRAAKGKQIEQQRGLLANLYKDLGNKQEAQALAREQMYRRAELKLQEIAARKEGAESRAAADALSAQLKQKRLQALQEAKDAARERGVTQYWEARKRAATEAAADISDPAQQAEALIASGDPELIKAGVALRKTTPEGGAGEGGGKAQSAIGKVMADFRRGFYGDPNDPNAQALARESVNRELAGSGASMDRLAAQWLSEYQTNPESLTPERQTALNVMGYLRGSPENRVLAGMPMFDIGRAFNQPQQSAGQGEPPEGQQIPPSLQNIPGLQRNPRTGQFRDPATNTVYDAQGNVVQQR